jgi:Domain of Unknown Function (DUF748)
MGKRSKRWLRWGGGVAGAVALYALAGGWILPQVIKAQLPKFAESRMQRHASVGALTFNPFTLRLAARDLVLTEADGTPVLALDALAVELQWRSLLHRTWNLAEVRVVAPSLQLAIARDGSLNLARLIATLSRDDRDQRDEPASAMPRLVIARLMLEQGKVVLHDRHAGYDDTFAPIAFELHNLSTLPGEHGDYTLRADAGRGGSLHWQGKAGLNPLAGSGALVLRNLALPGLSTYLQTYAGVTVRQGRLSASLPYHFSYADGKFDARLPGATLALDGLALGLAGAAAGTGVGASADRVQLGWQLQLHTGVGGLQLAVDNAALAIDRLALAAVDGGGSPLTLERLGFDGGTLDLAARRVSLARVYAHDGQLDLSRHADGGLRLLAGWPGAGTAERPAQAALDAQAAQAAQAAQVTQVAQVAQVAQVTPAAAAAPGRPWVASVKAVAVSKVGALVADAASGVTVNLQDFYLNLADVSTDLARPLAFAGGVTVREGGRLTASGTLVPASGAVDAELALSELALAPLQPVLDRYVKLKLAGGSVAAAGRLRMTGHNAGANTGANAGPALRYDGTFALAGLALNELDNQRFAQAASIRAGQLALTVAPNKLDVAELRVVDPSAILVIDSDHGLHAQRLLVPQPATVSEVGGGAVTAPGAAVAEAFPVRVRRVRVENAKLDFTDLSLRPQFAARVVELNGLLTGLSTRPGARAQIDLDGRVDDYGLARIRGQLNPFAPTDHTDVTVAFKNLDLVSASPYSMKLAGYTIAQGKISLDLDYQVCHGQLQGSNRMVLDQLTLGERIDSPDALKLPLQLALALLKDGDGRIDLGVPVTGNLDDPQFSYGAVVWKAIGNIMGKVVTSPFRALGRLFGVDGDRLQVVEFDAGSDRLLPPEREKLQQVAQLLANKPELVLAVPGQYSTEVDGLALRTEALRRAVLARTGVQLAPAEPAGPLDLHARAVRTALRDLAGLAPGEPPVADASAFYEALQAQLAAQQTLDPDALAQLGARRAAAIVAQLKQAGAGAVTAGAAENIQGAAGQPVALTLGLSAK